MSQIETAHILVVDDDVRLRELLRRYLLQSGFLVSLAADAGEAVDQLGAEVRQVETRTPAEFEEGFRDFAGRGFALVFGHGFEYQEAAARVAADFPDTVFVTTSGNTLRTR